MSYGTDAWAKWVLNEDRSLPLLKAAWDAGIQTWDTADIYSNVSLESLMRLMKGSLRNVDSKGD
jgi:aryl-alcohol dehydrogenase-like predicted oxidoreductase